MLSFLIHPLVENAVKYGMQTSPMPLRIWIETRLHEGSLRIAVRNTGRWLPRSPNNDKAPTCTESGLENVRARLERAFPQKYALETFERDGCVNVVLDIQYDHEMPYEEKVTSDYR